MMRLEALRVRDVGRFRDATAIEGFGAQLNVLSGPNEFGKSTLLRALRLAFELPYDGRRNIDDIVPYGGAAPLIEVDFEASGRHWRLRKHYLSGKAATLVDRNDTSTGWRNKDVQQQLDRILQRTEPFNRFDVLWVAQKDGLGQNSTDDLKPLRLGQSLSGLIEGEIEAMALDTDAQRVHALVKKRLDDLRTAKTGRPRAGGAWQRALSEAEAAAAVLSASAERATAHSSRLAELSSLIAAQSHLASAEGIAALVVARDRAARALSDATMLVRAEQEAKLKRDAAQSRVTLAQKDHDELVKADAEMAAALQAAEQVQAELTGLQNQESTAADILKHCEDAVTQAQTGVTALEADLRQSRSREAVMQSAGHRDDLRRQLSELRAALAERQAAQAEAAALSAFTAPAIDALDEAIRRRDTLDAQMSAITPEVRISLAAGGAGRVRIDGVPLTFDTVLNPETPLEIEIEGIGRIAIAPNPAAANPLATAERAAARTKAANLLADLGVHTIADARAQLARHLAAEQRARTAALDVVRRAPEGEIGLSSALATLADVPEAPEPPARASAAIEADLAKAREAVSDAEQRLRAATARASDLARTRAGLESTRDAHRGRTSELSSRIGDDRAAQAQRARVTDALDAAKAAFTEAALAHHVFRDRRAAINLQMLESEAANSAARLAEAEAQSIELARRIHGIEKALEVSSDDDIEATHARNQEAAVATKRALDDVVDERDALQLLDDLFNQASATGRDRLAAPVLARIAPFLSAIFPGATIGLDGEHAPATLVRGEQTEEIARLSQGTREQIAILARLGLGKLLAERDAGVPLILDDALVFADDQRLAIIFKLLAEAARLHQVIVFNCRASTFATLGQLPGATRLTLVPWMVA